MLVGLRVWDFSLKHCEWITGSEARGKARAEVRRNRVERRGFMMMKIRV